MESQFRIAADVALLGTEIGKDACRIAIYIDRRDEFLGPDQDRHAAGLQHAAARAVQMDDLGLGVGLQDGTQLLGRSRPYFAVELDLGSPAQDTDEMGAGMAWLFGTVGGDGGQRQGKDGDSKDHENHARRAAPEPSGPPAPLDLPYLSDLGLLAHQLPALRPGIFIHAATPRNSCLV